MSKKQCIAFGGNAIPQKQMHFGEKECIFACRVRKLQEILEKLL